MLSVNDEVYFHGTKQYGRVKAFLPGDEFCIVYFYDHQYNILPVAELNRLRNWIAFGTFTKVKAPWRQDTYSMWGKFNYFYCEEEPNLVFMHEHNVNGARSGYYIDVINTETKKREVLQLGMPYNPL